VFSDATLLRCYIATLLRYYIATLRMLENGVLGKVFGPKRGEVAGAWKKQNREERNASHLSQDKREVIGSWWKTLMGHVARVGEMTHA
jgi:hypothetical protein